MLKEKFDGAHEVKQKRKNGRRMLVTKYMRYKNHQDTDLVYLVTSPDYCELDVKKGSLGTKGRECDPVSLKTDEIHKTVNNFALCFRHQKVSMVATCFAVTEATRQEEKDAQNAVAVNFTGVATSSVRNV